jgi:hypothetical protein
MGYLRGCHFPEASTDIIEKTNEVGLVRNDGMAGVALFKLEVIEKRLDQDVMAFHKKTIAAK